MHSVHTGREGTSAVCVRQLGSSVLGHRQVELAVALVHGHILWSGSVIVLTKPAQPK